MKKQINIVWLKRDLRLQDHAPLHEAEAKGIPYLILFLYEPEFIVAEDCSERHLQFQHASIAQMNANLKTLNQQVHCLYANALDAFKFFIEEFQVQHVFSHRESGNMKSFQRDLSLQELFKSHGILWKEFQRDGILRGIKNRDSWDEKWHAYMHSPITQITYSSDKNVVVHHPFQLPVTFEEMLHNYPSNFQPAGETYALRYLQDFLQQRAFDYSRYISKPLLSRKSCSRLSPYLAWGNISVRQAYQHTVAAMQHSKRKNSYLGFLSRLKWHCHFIQKFESDCSYETQCINRGFEEFVWHKNEKYLQAWKQGNTGVPIVDACMRCLHQTGWLNFRMRAMLVSFLCHYLQQDWRWGMYHLAQLFLDFEPGIHYTQFQMQAGTTGVNLIRVYNPIKNSLEHDAEAKFISMYVPELAALPVEFKHEPFRMTELEMQVYGVELGKDYPWPIVDLSTAAKEGRDRLWQHRKNAAVKEDGKRILEMHTRRKR